MISIRGRFESEIVVRGGIRADLRAPFWEIGRTHCYLAASDGTVFRVERDPGWRFVCVVAGSGKWQVSSGSRSVAETDDEEAICFTSLAWVVVTTELAGELPASETPHSCRRKRARR